MKRNLIQVATAANTRFFPGLLVSLGSSLASASGNFDYRIFVLDGGLSADEWLIMDSCLQRLGEKKGIQVELCPIDATGSLIAGLPTRRGSSLTFARLAIPSIIDGSKCVYMDSDVLCLRGVEEFWNAINDTTALVAVRDPLGCLGRDSLTRQLPTSKRKQPYFNAGVIGMNLDRWREPNIQSQLSELLPTAESYKYVDQSLLNFVSHDQWHELPSTCNRLLTLAACGELANTSCLANYHYIGARKPWLSSISNFYRHVPNLLFDRMHHWILGGQPCERRSICQRSLVTARKKQLIYRIFLPSRGRQYSAALAAHDNAEMIANYLWNNWKQHFNL